jgi:transcriptional regulator with XRE-family HTH domain
MLDRTPFSLRLQSSTPANTGSRTAPLSEVVSNRSPTLDDGKVGRTIKDLRRRQGLTQKQVAGKIGVTGAQFHRYEAGATRVAASRLIAIATALGVRPEVLMMGEAHAFQPEAVAIKVPPATGDLVELVELFTSLPDERRRGAVLGFARSVAVRQQAPADQEG